MDGADGLARVSIDECLQSSEGGFPRLVELIRVGDEHGVALVDRPSRGRRGRPEIGGFAEQSLQSRGSLRRVWLAVKERQMTGDGGCHEIHSKEAMGRDRQLGAARDTRSGGGS